MNGDSLRNSAFIIPHAESILARYGGRTYARTLIQGYRGDEVNSAPRSGFPPSWTLAALPPFEMNSPEEVDGRYKLVRDAVCPRGGYIVLTCRLFVVGPDARPLMSRKKRAIILGNCRNLPPRVLRYVRAASVPSLPPFVLFSWKSRCCKSGGLNGITAVQRGKLLRRAL